MSIETELQALDEIDAAVDRSSRAFGDRLLGTPRVVEGYGFKVHVANGFYRYSDDDGVTWSGWLSVVLNMPFEPRPGVVALVRGQVP